MEVKLSELTGTQAMRDHGDIEGLKASIKRLGLLQPLVITPDMKLVAGRRRFQSLTELGVESAPVHVVNPENDYKEFLMALDENLKRKEMTWQEEALCELEEKRIYEACYPETKHGENQHTRAVADSATPRYTAAKAEATGVSERKIQEEIQLAKAIEENPELEKVKTKRAALTVLREKNRPEPKPMVAGQYDVILADPPWRYDFSETESREIENQYPTMTQEELKSLDIPSADNSVLFLWATAPKLKEAFEVLEAWGFDYRTCAVWDKEKIGMGYWFRGQHELLLVGVKGQFSPPATDKRVSSVIREPRSKHSQKPEVIFELIESMFPDRQYLELFARNSRDGWASWGNDL